MSNSISDTCKVPAGHSHDNGHQHHHHHHVATEVNISLDEHALDDARSSLQLKHGQNMSFWTAIKKELRPVLAERQTRKLLWLLAFNVTSIVVLLSWCNSTRSIALEAYTYTVWFNFLSLLTSLLSVWVSQQGPSINFSLGYERWEVLAVFASTVLAQLAALMVAKESVERLLEQPQVHTGRLLLGGGMALTSHLIVLYGSNNPALDHVMSAAASSWLQEHVADLSQSLCSTLPLLRALLLPRVNPLLLVASTGAIAIFLTNLLIELRDYHMMDTLASFVIIIVTCATMFPMSVYSGKVLLQTTPSHVVGQLDKCLRETLTIDGVLEFRNEHFWTLSFGKLAGSLHVRVRRDADEQLVLAHVMARLSPLVPVLRVQVVKDDWNHSSPFFASTPIAFPPSPFTPAQPNNNLLFSGASSLDPDKFPYKPRYLLYDVNPPEGFNLRRDVYLRIAILIKHLQDLKQEWKLVLPPWGNMYHWHSKDVGDQNKLPWSLFFDIPSMNKFIPVLEMHQFLQEYGRIHLDQVFFLQHYTSMWSEGKWEEKMDIEECYEELPYKEMSEGVFKGWFWGYRNISASSVKCLSFQGHATSLMPLLINTTVGAARTVMLDRAEVALHHMFGDVNYWQARRSMRFSPHLVKIATVFRAKKLNSTDEQDNTIRPSDWQMEKQLDITKERGGNYMCVHLRRRDFLWGRSKSVPSIIGAAVQISKVSKKDKLTTIFIATDATNEEIKELKTLLVPLQIKLFKPTLTQRMELKDGGVAIVEQIICSHARVFYGTYESTFSFRIQEEREIMGFHPDKTFNRLCGDDEEECTPPSRWRIEY